MIHLFFISYDFSGAETYADQLRTYLRSKADLAIYEINFSGNYQEFTVEDIGGLTTSGIGWKFHFPKIVSRYLIERGYGDAFVVPPLQILFGWLKTNAGDSVIFHSNRDDFINALVNIRSLIDFHTVSTVHFLPKHYSWKELDGYKEELSETKSENYTKQLELSDKIICVTEFAAESIKKNDNVSTDKVSVIYNGYSFDESSSEVNRGRYGLSDEDVVMLFVGRITSDKGVFSLLTAFQNIHVKYANVKLILAGDGDYRLINAFKEACGESLLCMGKQSRDVVSELYCLADVGVIPSKYEQCSYVALEMMSRRLAVVTANTPGLRELFVDEESGLFVDVSRGYDSNGLLDILIDVDMLERQIVRLICDPRLRLDIGRSGYERWQERFTAQRMAEQTYDLYKNLA